MAGPQFEKPSPRSSIRSHSSSPRPRLSSSAKLETPSKHVKFNGYNPSHPGSSEIIANLEHKQTALSASFLNQVSVTPLNSGKRSPKTYFSHGTDKRDSKFKKRNMQSPVKETEVASKDNSPIFIEEKCDSSLAVPKVFAIPPNPSLLPNPPRHWVKGNETHCLANKQQCRVVTQCLMSHLTSTGILIAA